MKFDPSKAVFRSAQDVKDYLAPFRAMNKTVVTTNGCFDIIHSGHIQYLTEAAQIGDILVVGVNSDATVGKLKGPERPLQNENDRVLTIASLKMVDCAFIFPEDDPRAFLEIIKPDIHVKGGDYNSDIIERETVEKNGGRIEIVSFIKGYSTTNLVKRIKTAG